MDLWPERPTAAPFKRLYHIVSSNLTGSTIMKYTLCTNCNNEISNNNYQKHINSCLQSTDKIKILDSWKKSDGNYQCPFCDCSYSKYGLGSHIYYTHSSYSKNVNIKQVGRHGIKDWQQKRQILLNNILKHGKIIMQTDSLN